MTSILSSFLSIGNFFMEGTSTALVIFLGKSIVTGTSYSGTKSSMTSQLPCFIGDAKAGVLHSDLRKLDVINSLYLYWVKWC